MIRQEVRKLVENINPIDKMEEDHITDAKDWIDSGADIFRIKKPDTPNKHLVSYFVVADGDYILLVDHINAQKWLPSGGHVEINEHPKDTVSREVQEELNINAEFLSDSPIMVTVTVTQGISSGHTDVSFWYVIKGDRTKELKFDDTEFNGIKWFHIDNLPQDNVEPHLSRFVEKLKKMKSF